MEILKDRRLSVSLKAVAKMGGDLGRLTNPDGQLAEEVGGELLGQAGSGEAEAKLRRVAEGISAAQEKVLRVGHVLIDEAESGTKKAIGAYKGALKTVIGGLLLNICICLWCVCLLLASTALTGCMLRLICWACGLTLMHVSGYFLVA